MKGWPIWWLVDDLTFPRILSSWNFEFQYLSLASSRNNPANYIHASSTFAIGKQKNTSYYTYQKPPRNTKHDISIDVSLLGLLLGNKTQRFSLRFVLLIQRFCWTTLVFVGILESYQNNSKETNFIKQGIKHHHLQMGFVTTPSTKRVFFMVPLPSRRGTDYSSPKSPQLWLSFLLWTSRTTVFHGFPTQWY